MERNVFVVYDQHFTWDPIESEGMYVCCGQDTLDACMTHQEKYNQTNWQKVAKCLVFSKDVFFVALLNFPLSVAGKQRDAN